MEATKSYTLYKASDLLDKVVSFVSIEKMDVKGLGKSTCKKLVDCGLVKSLSDIFELTADSLLAYEIVSKESTAVMLEKAVTQATTTTPYRLLVSLDVPHIDKEVFRKLMLYKSDIRWLSKASKYEISKKTGVPLEKTHYIELWFLNGDNKRVFNRLLEVLIISDSDPKRKSRKLLGQFWIITGSVHGYTRSDLTKLLKSHGAEVLEEFNEKLTHCYVGDNPTNILNRCMGSYRDITIMFHRETKGALIRSLEDNDF